MRVGGIVVALGLAAAAVGQPPRLVRQDAARLERVEQWREVTGQLRSVRRSLLAAEEAGLVTEFTLEEGDSIEAGRAIVRLHDVRARIAVASAEAHAAAERAAVAEEEATLGGDLKDLERYERSAAAGVTVEMELDRARRAVAASRARVEGAKARTARAEADLELARQRLADMTILAPFAGVVVAKRTEVGEWIAAGGPIVEIVSLDALEARIHVSEAYINRVSESAEVQLRIDATGETVWAPVTRIIPDADPLSRLFPVRVRVPNEDGKLRPGMSVTGLVPTGAMEETLTVSKDAVVRLGGSEVVYFDAGGKAAPARVRTLFAVGDRVAVWSQELRPGAMTIVEGNERLNPGDPVIPQGAGAGRDGEGGPGADPPRPAGGAG